MLPAAGDDITECIFMSLWFGRWDLVSIISVVVVWWLGIGVGSSRAYDLQRKMAYICFVALYRRVLPFCGRINGETGTVATTGVPRRRIFFLFLEVSYHVRSYRVLCSNKRAPFLLYRVSAYV